MKIKKVYLFTAFVLAVLSAVNFLQNWQKNTKFSSVALVNLEAIGQEMENNESGPDAGGGNTVDCYCSFKGINNGDKTVYDFGSCKHVVCISASDKRTCRAK